MTQRYALYEESVQSPENDIEWFRSVYKNLRGRYATHLREDFCGTFLLCCEWVKKNRRNTAVGLDIDPEPVAYGRRNHFVKLTPAQKKRVTILKQNVLKPTKKVDLIIANNFSFFVFKERELLVKYLRGCAKSLRRDGVQVLELAGGPGMVQKLKETKTLYRGKKPKFTYIWDQKSYDPVTHEGMYAIHFKFPDGRQMKNAFTYDWRVWTIREVREAMMDAGFRDTAVYWETAHKGAATGEYVRSEKGENDWSWIAYVAGLK